MSTTTDSLSDNLRMLADSARDYTARGYGDAVRAASLAHPAGCAPARWKEFAELGWLGLPLPEDMQGLGGSLQEICALVEPLGRALVLEPFVACAVGAAGLLERAARVQAAASLRGTWGVDLASGQMRIAAGVSSASTQAPVRALPAGAGTYVLQGAEPGVPGGAGADAFLLAATLDRESVGLFLVPHDAPGLRQQVKRWYDGRAAVDLQLQEVIGQPVWAGTSEELRALRAPVQQRQRVVAAAEAVGLMQGAFDATLDYVRMRRQFGRSIATNQVVQHRLVDLHVEITEARALAHATAALIDAQQDGAERLVAALGATVAATARHVWEEAVQLHGAIGMTQECPLAPFVHRLAVAANADGHADVHLEELAALVLDAPAMAEG